MMIAIANSVLLFVRKNWKDVALIGLVIFCISSVHSCYQRGVDNDRLLSSVDSLKVQVREYKDRNGKLVSQAKTHLLTIGELREYSDQLGIEVNGLKKQVGNLNRLVSYWKIQASARDTFYVTGVDTVFVKDGVSQTGKAFHYSNRYLTLDQLYHPGDGTLSTLYDYRIDFELTAYRKGQTLFKPGTLVTDVKFSDQNISVKEIKGLVVKEPPKKFYEKGWFWGLVGFIGGVFAVK